MESSKLGEKSTVFRSRSASNSSAIGANRASVYLMAAGGSPSTLPKLPWPVISMWRIENGWAMRTRASYTETSPWGWYLPSTSPQIRAVFR